MSVIDKRHLRLLIVLFIDPLNTQNISTPVSYVLFGSTQFTCTQLTHSQVTCTQYTRTRMTCMPDTCMLVTCPRTYFLYVHFIANITPRKLRAYHVLNPRALRSPKPCILISENEPFVFPDIHLEIA